MGKISDLIFIFPLIVMSVRATHPYFQVVHTLDPDIEEYKYYSSWNSDQWIQWARQRYFEDLRAWRNLSEVERDEYEAPSFGLFVNIIIVASQDDLNSAFSETSNRSYTDDGKQDFFWSDTAFPVFAVVRNPNITDTDDTAKGEDETIPLSPSFTVFRCTDKKMFINAQLDLSDYNPISITHLFPKKVKNPKDRLRIPLTTCSKVSQTRGLLDEISFQLGSTKG